MIFAQKITPEDFHALLTLEKSFAVRTDRPDCPYVKGDYLALNEYTEEDGFSGDCLLAEIVSVSHEPDHMKPESVILGLRVAFAQKASDE